MSKITVMTFNLRVEADIDGINHLKNRKGKIMDTINTYQPDLIGFQETRDGTRDWLRDTLVDYTLIGCGRLADYRGECPPLAFRKDKFMMISSENFWLSSTPSVPGSTYAGSDQSSCPRMCTVATLVHIESGKKLVFLNTHTDHKGSLSRILASAQILQYLSEKGLPSVVTGDLNATPDSTEIRMLSASKYFPLTDATASVGGTFHAFGGYSDEQAIKIDYIFTNLPVVDEESFAVPDPHEEGIYISDHRPVMASVLID